MFAIHSWAKFSMDKFLPLTIWYWLGEQSRFSMWPKGLFESTLQNQAELKFYKSFHSLCSYKSLFTEPITVAGSSNGHVCLCHCRLVICIISSYIEQLEIGAGEGYTRLVTRGFFRKCTEPVHWYLLCLLIPFQINSWIAFLSLPLVSKPNYILMAFD